MKIKTDKYYMIRHIPSGLLKTGGHNANFNKTCKIWRGSRVKNHLRLFSDGYPQWGKTLFERINHFWKPSRTPVEECEIIEIDLAPTQTQPLKEFIEEELE